MLTGKTGAVGRHFSTTKLVVIVLSTVLVHAVSASVIIEESPNGRAQVVSSGNSGELVEIENGGVVDVDNLDPKDPRRKFVS